MNAAYRLYYSLTSTHTTQTKTKKWMEVEAKKRKKKKYFVKVSNHKNVKMRELTDFFFFFVSFFPKIKSKEVEVGNIYLRRIRMTNRAFQL